eukprot:TRINITY_DN289_c0_g2_i1.p2 TRINITY_DN289_c0_g2~~TRINITY_DN289_c0_g2_i1.p2  ORF type:complete len:552 (+),score=139.99 TRINITY_DN289_c0_g2_i1:16141-17796(+)
MNKKQRAPTADPKVSELQAKIKELNAIIEGYKSGELGAEGRIKALNEMHTKKVKALLKSIDQLKKESHKEKFLQKDNMKAKMLEQYKKDIESQDFIIGTLRKLIGDNDKCDRALIQELNKGPDRIRSATREELKMENKKLKGMLQLAKERNDKLEALVLESNKTQPGDITASVHKKSISEAAENGKRLIALEAELDDLKLKSATEVAEKNNRILELVKELDDLKVEIKGKEEKINRTAELTDKLYEDIKKKSEFETGLALAQARCKTYEQEIQRLLKESAVGEREDKVGDITRDELELQNIGLTDQLKKLRIELENEKTQASEEINIYKSENERLKNELMDLQDQIRKVSGEKADQENLLGNLQQKLTLHEENYEQHKKTSEESYQQLIDQISALKNEKASLNEKYMRLLVQVEELETQLQAKTLEVDVYQAKLAEFDKENKNLRTNMGGSGIGLISEDKEAEIEKLKKKVKELTRREVELLEALEEEQDKNKAENEKIKMVHLVATQKRTTSLTRIEEELVKYKALYDQTLKKLAKYESAANQFYLSLCL